MTTRIFLCHPHRSFTLDDEERTIHSDEQRIIQNHELVEKLIKPTLKKGQRCKIWGWSCGKVTKVQVGDRAYLKRTGTQPYGLFAAGYVGCAPLKKQLRVLESDCKHLSEAYLERTDTCYWVLLEIDSVVDFDRPLSTASLESMAELKTFKAHFNFQQGGCEFAPKNPEVALFLDQKWNEYCQKQQDKGFAWNSSESQKNPIINKIFPNEVDSNETFSEGAVRQVSVNAYERNPQARQKCIEYYGTDCFICGFNFGKVYGQVGEGFIHIHHLRPLSSIAKEYKVDPINDLRPVCPNCHAMIHRHSPPLNIKELRDLL